MFFDVIKIFKSIMLIIFNKKVIIYTVRSRFGSIAAGIALFETFLEKNKKDYIFIINMSNNIIFNRYLLRRKYIFFDSVRLPYFFLRVLTFLNIDKKIAPFHKNFHLNDEGEVSKNFPYVDLNRIFKKKNNSDINKVLQSRYVVFTVKESEFYNSNSASWGKHNFKNFPQPIYEFDKFNRLIPLVKRAIKRGYKVVRAGRNLSKINFYDDNFFDYASSDFANDENDFLIAKHCQFVITNGTGFDALAALWFKKPIYYYNIRNYRYMHTNFPYRMFNPILCKKNDKTISYKDVLDLESKLWNDGLMTKSNFQHANYIIKKHGYEYIYYNVKTLVRSIDVFIDDFESLKSNDENDINNKFNNNSLSKFWIYYKDVYLQKLNDEGRPLNYDKIYNSPNEELLEY
jgi:putative glycosyltransferase (TIGR04372 family)